MSGDNFGKSKPPSQESANSNIASEDVELLNIHTWAEVIEKIIDETKDEKNKKRKRQILSQIDPDKFIRDTTRQGLKILYNKDHLTYRGFVFEGLVLSDMEMSKVNRKISSFISKCFVSPKLAVLKGTSMLNPDHVNVQIDTNEQTAYVVGMFEAKVDVMGHSQKHLLKQVDEFYPNLHKIIEHINRNKEAINEKHGFQIPANGVKIFSQQDIMKLIVMPRPDEKETDMKWYENLKSALKEKGWELIASPFTKKEVTLITKFLIKYYLNKKRKNI